MDLSDDNSDLFESAEESFGESDEETVKDVKVAYDKKVEKNTSNLRKNEVKDENNFSEHPKSLAKDTTTRDFVTYRKRPDKVKNSSRKSPKSPVPTSAKDILKESNLKNDISGPDIFFQDITNNLTFNINKSLNTIQQTSSCVKDLIVNLNSLPVNTTDQNEVFSYDETSPGSLTKSSKKVFSGLSVTNSLKLPDSRELSNKKVSKFEKVFESIGPELLEPLVNHNSRKQEKPNKKLFSCDISKKFQTPEVLNILDIDHKSKPSKKQTGNNQKFIPGVKSETIQKSDSKGKDPNLSGKAESLNLEELVKDSFDNSQSGATSKLFTKNNAQKYLKKEIKNDFLKCEEKFLEGASVGSNQNSALESHTKKLEERSLVENQSGDFRCAITQPKLIDTVPVINEQKQLVSLESCKELCDKLPDCQYDDVEDSLLEVSSNELKDKALDYCEESEFINKLLETTDVVWEDSDWQSLKTDSLSEENKILDDDKKNSNKSVINHDSENQVKENEDKSKDQLKDLQKNANEEDWCKEELSNIIKSNDAQYEKLQTYKNKFGAIDSKNNTTQEASEKQKNVKNLLSLPDTGEDEEGSDWDWNSWDEDKSENNNEKKTVTSKEKENCEEREGDDWDWDDWEDDNTTDQNHMTIVKGANNTENLDSKKYSKLDLLDEGKNDKQSNWGSWGVNMLLNKASAVTLGLSNVLEAGLGAPDPETLARMEVLEERKNAVENKEMLSNLNKESNTNFLPEMSLFGISNLVADVTSKIVEHSKIQEIGTKVITGGLDTLESFGRKTMEVLQEGDPGLRNKRALFSVAEQPALSEVLKEISDKANKEMREVEEKNMQKKCHFEGLFDDFEGLVHLEALEMLSKQCEIKIEQIRTSMTPQEKEDLEGVLEEVEQLCALDDYDLNLTSGAGDFKKSIAIAIEPLQDEISIKAILKAQNDIQQWLASPPTDTLSCMSVQQKLVSSLAQLTASVIHQYHKIGEILSVKECRKTVDEIDAISKMTHLLSKEISKISNGFILLSNNMFKENPDLEVLLKNIESTANRSMFYIKQAFDLLIPILQLGAAV